MSRKTIRDIRNEEFIEATLHAVYERGYHSVTLSEIAQVVGATAASINYYFGSKDKLIEATMRRLLSVLRTALIERLHSATTPKERVQAILEANFDDRLFEMKQCSVWVQFWSAAPYSPDLARLQNINRARVRSHFRKELRQLVPHHQIETVRRVLQSYMDGVWLQAAQTNAPLNAANARTEALHVLDLLLINPDRAL